MPAEQHDNPSLGRFLRPHLGKLLGVLALTIVLSVLVMLPPLLIRAVIDKVATEGRHSLFLPLGLCIVGAPLITAFCQYMQVLGIAYLGQRFVFDIRLDIYRHLLNMSLRFFGKHSTGKLVNRIMGDTGTDITRGEVVMVPYDEIRRLERVDQHPLALFLPGRRCRRRARRGAAAGLLNRSLPLQRAKKTPLEGRFSRRKLSAPGGRALSLPAGSSAAVPNGSGDAACAGPWPRSDESARG